MFSTFSTDDYFQTWYASSGVEHSSDEITFNTLNMKAC